MAKKVVRLQWTDLQREIASKAGEGLGFDELVGEGYTGSLVSKVLRAIKSGQSLPGSGTEDDNREPRSENLLLKPHQGARLLRLAR